MLNGFEYTEMRGNMEQNFVKNNYNPWRTATFILLALISIGVGFSGRIVHFSSEKSIITALALSAIVLLVQLPDLIKFMLMEKGGLK